MKPYFQDIKKSLLFSRLFFLFLGRLRFNFFVRIFAQVVVVVIGCLGNLVAMNIVTLALSAGLVAFIGFCPAFYDTLYRTETFGIAKEFLTGNL